MSDEDFFATSDETQQQPTDEMFAHEQQEPQSFDQGFEDQGFDNSQGFDNQVENQGFDSYQEAPTGDSFAQEEESAVHEEQPANYIETPKQLSAIREYEEKKYQALAEKDNESRVNHDKILEDAKTFKSKCSKDREERKESNSKKNKEDEELFRNTAETVHENVWENVMKYVDLNKTKSQSKLDKELDDMDEQILNKKKKKKNQKEEEEKPVTKKATEFDHLEVEQKDTTRLRKMLLELKAEAPSH